MFTIKSVSKGTTTGRFKTVKDAVEAAQYANEMKADGADDWIPEEKGRPVVDYSQVVAAAKKVTEELKNLSYLLRKVDSGWDGELSETFQLLRNITTNPEG
jgi:hypothetical protein